MDVCYQSVYLGTFFPHAYFKAELHMPGYSWCAYPTPINSRNATDSMPLIPGLQRRRLIPAPLPDTSSLGRKTGTPGQWVDLPPLGGTLKEPFEIKVYEIDDVERLQRRREGVAGTEVREPPSAQSLAC